MLSLQQMEGSAIAIGGVFAYSVAKQLYAKPAAKPATKPATKQN